MNIAEVKEEIRRSLLAYHRRDENGMYLYPQKQQRPLLLMGPPGIGKSAVMEQIAAECGVGLVSYTLTHHTRQSALGLPHITERSYAGKAMTVTEYTMSEIIAEIYDCMSRTGCREGILFIDEINCVSETLTPVMLQFLQNRQFGTHKVPDGWLIAAAGNPPEYNRSAKELDIVTLDRVRLMEIEPDLHAWMTYAQERGVHQAVLSYLRLHPEHFYQAESSASGRHFVTPRGWEDLSSLLSSYEALGFKVGEEQIRQFLGDEKTAVSFAAGYRIYRKYGTDYGIMQILDGTMEADTYENRMEMAGRAGLEERYILIGLLLAGIDQSLKPESEYMRIRKCFSESEDLLDRMLRDEKTPADAAWKMEQALQIKTDQGLVTQEEIRTELQCIRLLQELDSRVKEEHILTVSGVKALYEETAAQLLRRADKQAKKTGMMLENAFAFCEEGFGEDQEMLLLTGQLARNPRAVEHISRHGCDAFIHWSRRLALTDTELQEI